MCKEKEYQSFIDKKCSRIINGLEVYCSNKEKGCQWKGELKNMSTHLYKEKREGECQYEEVKCRYDKCQERRQRRYLESHEYNICIQRPFQCQYCSSKGTFLSITQGHYEECEEYPVTCPNKCVSTKMPRGSLPAHVNRVCPLQPVYCVFRWAGCNDKPLRKDVHVHTADTKHMTLLAVACGQLKKENEQIKEENEKIIFLEGELEKLRKNVKTLENDNTFLKDYILSTAKAELPVEITRGIGAVHFECGRHMSARMMGQHIQGDYADYIVLLAFHEGKLDKLNPKPPKIYAKYRGKVTPLIEDTEATYVPLPMDILNTINMGWDDVPQGVIKVPLGKYSVIGSETVIICIVLSNDSV